MKFPPRKPVPFNVKNLCLIRTLNVVEFDSGGNGHIRQLPVGTAFTITGLSSLAGLIEILHHGEVCHAFEKDVRDRSDTTALGVTA